MDVQSTITDVDEITKKIEVVVPVAQKSNYQKKIRGSLRNTTRKNPQWRT